MTGNQAFAVLLKKLKSVASGVKGVAVDSSDPSKLLFTLNDNSTISITIPNPVTTVALVNKLSIDTDGYLCYDGKRVCDFTDDEITLLKKFSISTTDGSLMFDNTPLSMLTQQERETISNLAQNFVFNKDSSGSLLSVEVNGAVISQTTDPVTGDTAVKIGDVIVSGKETVTASSTTTDGNGNPVTKTVTTTKTPTGTEQTTVTNSINPDNGNSINTVEVIKGSAEGVNVGSASGTKTTTETDSTGVVIDTKVEDVTYTNGVEDQWMTQEEVDNIINGFSTLGWNM